MFFSLLRLDLHIPEFFWGNPVLLFESPVKTGIILKSEHQVSLGDTDIAEYSVLAGRQPLLHNILMDGDPCIFFKNMGNMIFTGIKFPSQTFQR